MQDSDEVLASPVLGPLAREAVARLDPGDRPEVGTLIRTLRMDQMVLRFSDGSQS